MNSVLLAQLNESFQIWLHWRRQIVPISYRYSSLKHHANKTYAASWDHMDQDFGIRVTSKAVWDFTWQEDIRA